MLLVVFLMQLFLVQLPIYAETIYTKDGQVIPCKIGEIANGTVWYETTSGDITEYVGLELSNIEKILNDDGSTFKYSPGNVKPSSG